MAPRRKRELDVPVPIQYPNGALAEPQWRACRDILARVYKLKEANRDVAEIFCALPAKEMYEDYYVAITEPECLDHIAATLAEQQYPTPEAFYAQLQLVFLNAKHYNEEGSQVWADADTLQKLATSAWQEFANAPRVKEEPKAAPSADHGLSPGDAQVIAATEARYPRWPGPVRVIHGHYPGGIIGSGWWGEGMGIIDDAAKRIATVLQSLEAQDAFSSLQSKAYSLVKTEYRTVTDFDVEMTRLFAQARRWYTEQSTEYGHILLLQRYYQGLTGAAQASLSPHGPGKAQDLSSEPGYLERKYTSAVRAKGLEYKIGDWVHLSNPDDAARPIVGQIWKTYIPTTKGKRTHHISVAWYYRPEQTIHTAKQQFYKREVLRSGSFCDHPVEDILEKVTVQPWGKYVRGRPRAPDYYPGWPSYVCVNRYSEKAWKVSPLQHWQSGLPEEQNDSISYFEKPVTPILFPSPLQHLTAVPGFFAEPRAIDVPESVPPTPNKRRRTIVVPPITMPLPPPSTETFAMMLGGAQHLDQVAYKDHLPVETTRLFDCDARQSVLWFSGPPLPPIRPADRPSHSLAYLAHLARS